jgi:hypothetical protein
VQPELCPENVTFYQFRLVSVGKTLTLQNDAGVDFAVLNTAMTRKLEVMLKVTGMWCTCFIQTDEWLQHAQKQGLGSSAFMADINVYGPSEQSNAVAGILSNAGLFLQQPRVFLSHIQYQNPHILSLSQNAEYDFSLTPLFPLEGSSPKQNQEEEKEVEAEVDLKTILDTLPHHDFLLQQTPSTGKLKTELLL